MKQLIEEHVDGEELEKLYGGSGTCYVDLTCGTKIYSDEDSEENVIF